MRRSGTSYLTSFLQSRGAELGSHLIPPGEANPNIAAPAPGSVTASQAAGVVAALATYFEGINSGDYAAAWATLSPSNQQTTTLQRFAAGTASSYDSGLSVLEAHAVSPSTVAVALAFNSLQASAQGPDGDTCDNWTLDYTLIQASDGSWLIDSAAPHAGSRHSRRSARELATNRFHRSCARPKAGRSARTLPTETACRPDHPRCWRHLLTPSST